MRVIAVFFALILVVAMMMMTSLAHAQSKSICSPIKNTTGIINPGQIVATTLNGMSNRGSGSYSISISPCTSGPALSPCAGLGFVAVSNSSGCSAVFDTAVQRPTVLTAGNGFSVMYGSSQNANTFSITMLCSPTTSLGVNSASMKFATQTNKQGGVGYIMVAQSAAACASVAPPPPPPGKSCVPTTILGQVVNFQWAAQYLELVDGFGPEVGFLFSPCADSPSAPSWIPGGGSCSTGFGYVTMFSNNGCMPWSWDVINSFSADNSGVNIGYSSTKNPGVNASVSIVCMMGEPVITSPGGNYRNVSNTLYFELGIQDLCGGQTYAPWTAPPQPASMSGSSNQPSGGSGSSGMPSGGSGSSGMPSGGSGSSGMPSGGSGSMPSGGSSNQPSGGSSGGGDPSGGSLPSAV